MTIISTLDWIKFAVNARIPNSSIITSDLDATLISGKGIVTNDDNDSVTKFVFDNIQEFDFFQSTPKNDYYSSREISQ